MKLRQVIARIALAGCFLAMGMDDATAVEAAANTSAPVTSSESAVTGDKPKADSAASVAGEGTAQETVAQDAAVQTSVSQIASSESSAGEVVASAPAAEASAAVVAPAADVAKEGETASSGADVVASAPAAEASAAVVAPAADVAKEGDASSSGADVVASAPAAEASAAVVAPAVTAEVAPAAKAKANPWKGTFVGYEHVFSAVSLDKASGQTWNPYYAHSFTLQPVWRFHDYVGLRLRLDVEQELTDADETVRRYEWMWSDLNVEVNAGKGYTEKVTGININGNLRLGLPVSKISRARTMFLALSPSLTISRKFPVLKGLTIAYSGRFTYQFHQSTTAQYDGTSLSCGDPDSAECERFTNTGIRNAQTVLVHGPSIRLDILDNLSFSVSYSLRRSGLYELDDYEVYDSASGIHLGTLSSGENDIDARYGQAFSAELAWAPIDMVGLALGFITVYSDLRQNGSYQTPLFNQFTNIYLNLSLDIDSVVQAFR